MTTTTKRIEALEKAKRTNQANNPDQLYLLPFESADGKRSLEMQRICDVSDEVLAFLMVLRDHDADIDARFRAWVEGS